MISLILPYWSRQEAADKAILQLEQCYRGLDLEVIVVDDGNHVPFRAPETSLNLKVVRLPEKPAPTPQSVAWNEGVKAATNDIIVLSCVEIIHERSILQEMRKELGDDKNAYVLAAAWCPEENKWHCHSSEKIPFCPQGTGPAFCGMMHKELFNRVSGFSLEYMDGAGYEDKDFILKLHHAGARFVIRDDLVVIHPKAGAKIQWEPEGFIRNFDIFKAKWPSSQDKPVTFVCLKAGDAYGPEYVNILYDMVRRNLPYGYPGRFVCITDNPEGLNDGIEIKELPSQFDKWWGKLFMFRRGEFRDGETCVFADLDTLVVGSLVDLARYSGDFATLRDFYYPSRLGPAIIAWKVSEKSHHIYDEWERQGFPRHEMGDLWWLNTLDNGEFAKSADILQDIYPGKFVSFKVSCSPYPPAGASVICFHGQPKPSNCGQKWVEDVWRIGGGGMAELEIVSNTNREIVKKHVVSSSSRDIPWLSLKEPNDKHAVIVAGGPSLKETMREVKTRHSQGQHIFAVNGAAKMLNEHGITPDFQVIIDAREENAKFLTDGSAKHQFLASQCHPSLFDLSQSTTLFHLNTEGILETIPDNEKPLHLISSGTTAGLAAIVVAYTQGYRFIHLHGFDSSYEDYHHAYEQKLNDDDKTIEVVVNGEKFKCAPWMLVQAQEFQQLAPQLADAGVVMTIAGHGLLPYIARCMYPEAATV